MVELSRKHSIALTDTDVCLLTQTVPEDVVVLEDPMEVRRVISLETANQQLIFVAPTDQEAQVLICGLKMSGLVVGFVVARHFAMGTRSGGCRI